MQEGEYVLKSNSIAVPVRLSHTLRRALSEYKIIFLSAAAGWGKTTALRQCVKEECCRYIPVEPGRTPRFSAKEALVILDDFHRLSPELEKRMAEIIHRSPKRQHLVLLSRGPLPDYLLPYQLSGNLRLLTAEQMVLGGDEILQLANFRDISLTKGDLRRICHETKGYPPYICFMLDMLPETGLSPEGLKCSRRQLYAYFDVVLFHRWDRPTRKVMLSSAYVQTITTSWVETVLGERNAWKLLFHISRSTGLLQEKAGDVWSYSDPELLLPYLRWKAEQELAQEEIRQLHMLGGAWCAEQGDYAGAVKHYGAAGNRSEVIKTLIQAVQNAARPFVLCQLSDSLHSLTESEIRTAPELAFAMGRISMLYLWPKQAKYWFSVLEEQAAEGTYTRAVRYLFYLGLCLPWTDNGPKSPEHSLPSYLGDRPVISPTAGLPSVLRGERDLSGLMRHPADSGQQWLPRIFAAALGGRADSVAQLLEVEYRLEQGENVTPSLFQWHPLQLRIQEQGALDLEFVCVVLTARSLCVEGQFSEAAAFLLRFRQQAEAAGADELLSNIDAARCRIALMEDRMYVEHWLAQQPPTGGVFSVLDGYRLMTRVRCHIKRAEYRTALLFLGQMLVGYERCDRTLDQMEGLILAAICCRHLGESGWRDYLGRALSLGQSCHYTAVFAQEGAALMPLLEEYTPDGTVSSQYWFDIMRGTIKQAALSPAYLRPERSLAQPLTPAEHTILTLLICRKSVQEMGQIMGIQVSTVRTHLHHLFSKLGVHSQKQARQAAVQLGLV